jgi:hypothetical protein
MKLKSLLGCMAMLFAAFTSRAVDPSISVYIDHPVYKAAHVFEFDIMMKANGPTSSLQLRTFQAGLYVNPAWVNGGTLTVVNAPAYSQMSSPGYNGAFQWNATDKLINCSVNFDVYNGPSNCVATTITTTPVVITKLRVTNSVDFTCSTPDIKFNYVSNVSPLRLRTSFSWREVACTTNYDMFYPGRTYGGTATFNGEAYSSSDADGRSPITPAVSLTGFCLGQLKLVAYIEGYYNGSGTMQPVMVNQNVDHASADQTDTITVIMKLSSPTQDVTQQVILNADGSAYIIFPLSYIGRSCEIGVLHRNAIQTWSAAPVTLASRTTYNFSTTASAAFGNNTKAVDGTHYAFYSGDINNDDYIDIFDFPDFDADNQNFVSGVYAKTDLNGDGYVDIFDFPIYDANNQAFVSAIIP